MTLWFLALNSVNSQTNVTYFYYEYVFEILLSMQQIYEFWNEKGIEKRQKNSSQNLGERTFAWL